MQNNISVPLSKIGDKLRITFGNFVDSNNSDLHFQSLRTTSTTQFFNENEIIHDELGNPKIFGFLTITRENKIFRVEGQLSFCAKLECVRSLDEFQQELSIEINAFYVSDNSYKCTQFNKVNANSQNFEEELEFSTSDLETYTFQGNSLIFDEMLLDTLYCAIPELPLCRPHCKGLCSECGTDLNEYDLLGRAKLISHSSSCSLNQLSFLPKI